MYARACVFAGGQSINRPVYSSPPYGAVLRVSTSKSVSELIPARRYFAILQRSSKRRPDSVALLVHDFIGGDAS